MIPCARWVCGARKAARGTTIAILRGLPAPACGAAGKALSIAGRQLKPQRRRHAQSHRTHWAARGRARDAHAARASGGSSRLVARLRVGASPSCLCDAPGLVSLTALTLVVTCITVVVPVGALNSRLARLAAVMGAALKAPVALAFARALAKGCCLLASLALSCRATATRHRRARARQVVSRAHCKKRLGGPLTGVSFGTRHRTAHRLVRTYVQLWLGSKQPLAPAPGRRVHQLYRSH